MVKRCCQLNCTQIKGGNEGYQVAFGFMLWACPNHAEQWRLFDKQLREYEQALSDEYAIALEKFEAKWDEQYQARNPRPEPPPFQSSTNNKSD